MRKAFGAALVAAASFWLAVPCAANAGDLSPADLNALKSYNLSMDKINAMQAAMDEAKHDAALSGGMKNVGGDSKSIAEMEAKLNSMPQAMALYRKHGLTAHDAVVMPFALMDAGMVVAYPSAAPKLADRVSPGQVAFYKQHQAELKKVSWLSGGSE
jgi:hypothetical protein